MEQSPLALAAKRVIKVLKRETKLEFCPTYFEEPCSIHTGCCHDEYDVVASGLRLTNDQRKCIALKSREEGIGVSNKVQLAATSPYLSKRVGLVFLGLASLTSQPQWIFEEMTKQIRLLNGKVKEGKHREGLLLQQLDQAKDDESKHDLKTKSQELEAEKREFEFKKNKFEVEMEMRKQKLEEQEKLHEDYSRKHEPSFTSTLLNEGSINVESQDHPQWVMEDFSRQIRSLRKIVEESQQREDQLHQQLYQVQMSERQATRLLHAEKMKSKAKSAELNLLFLRLKQQSKNIAEREQRLNDQKKDFEDRMNSVMTSLNNKEKKLQEEQDTLTRMKEKLKELEEQKQQICNDLKSKTQELEQEKQEFQNERHRLEVEMEKRKQKLEKQEKRLYDEYKRKNEDLEVEKMLLETERKDIIEQMKIQQEEFNRKQRCLEIEQEALHNQGSMKCTCGCSGDKILFRQEAEDLIYGELQPNICCFVVEYASCGFHLIHDFIKWAAGEWKQLSQQFTKINNWCNVVRIYQSDIPAKVVLYAPWPEETKIECYVSCKDEKILQDVAVSITHGIDTILAQRQCCIKYFCEHKACQQFGRHLASPLPSCSDHFICGATQEPFYCESSKHRFLAKIRQRVLTSTRSTQIIRRSISQVDSDTYEESFLMHEHSRITINSSEQQEGLPALPPVIPLIEAELTITDLMEMVAPYALSKWKMVGSSLQLCQQLDGIASQYRGDCYECYQALFKTWEDIGQPPFNWNTILDILCKPHICKYSLVEHIVNKLTRDK